MKIPNFFLVFLILICSCGPTTVTREELSRYVVMDANGLSKIARVDDFQIRATYRPTDLMIAQELNFPVDSTKINRLQKKYQDHYCFVLSLSKNGKEAVEAGNLPYEKFSEIVQTVSFRMASFVNMTTSKSDTITLADYVYNPTFGMGSSNDLLLIFNGDKLKQSEWMQINVSEFGLGLGHQSLRFRNEDIKATPHIDFTSIKL